jgi:hypothetical protein
VGILSTQYCTHAFSVLIVKDQARLICWERGGAVFTASMPYSKDEHLFDFFIYFHNSTLKARSHDKTIHPATIDEAKCVKEDDMFKDVRCLIMTIHDQVLGEQKYIIPSPASQLHIPVGWWTRTSITVDI